MLYQLSYFRKYTLNFRGGYLTRYYCQIPNKLVIWHSITIMIMPNIFYAQVTPDLFYIGFIPGVLATVLGTMLAGLAIYKREMAQLFKELET